MASKLVISADGAHAVYEDKWLPILQALGTLSIERATSIEYSADAQEWIAVYLPTGEEIAHGQLRSAVLEAEVAYLEKEVIR